MKHKRLGAIVALASLAVMMLASTAFAYQDPAAGDLFYDAYDIVINQMMGGPIGYVIAAFMTIGGIILLVQGRGFLLPVICLVGAAVIIKAKDIVSSFGFTMDAALVELPQRLPQMMQLLI